MKPKLLFIDRDGTIIKEPPVTYQIDSIEQLEFLPGAIRSLSNIAKSGLYQLVMVTNQDGLGTESYPEERFWPIQNLILRILKNEGVEFASIHIDRSFPEDNLPTRKPGTAMLTQYLNGTYDIAQSYVIGDRLTDVELAKNLGCKAILIKNFDDPTQAMHPIDLVADQWQEIEEFLLYPHRKATIHRITHETDIFITIDLDGSGNYSIETGIGFFNHMLEQLAKHGKMDLEIRAKGDLHIDEHHTIEDVGICLGEAFREALADKRGIERYGFTLPMDDALAQVAIDFGGRPWLKWKVKLKREKIGDMPTEMVKHFFKSFSDAARCNLHIQANGENEHHIVESIFKAFAKACRFATRRVNDDFKLPSTKGIL